MGPDSSPLPSPRSVEGELDDMGPDSSPLPSPLRVEGELEDNVSKKNKIVNQLHNILHNKR